MWTVNISQVARHHNAFHLELCIAAFSQFKRLLDSQLCCREECMSCRRPLDKEAAFLVWRVPESHFMGHLPIQLPQPIPLPYMSWTEGHYVCGSRSCSPTLNSPTRSKPTKTTIACILCFIVSLLVLDEQDVQLCVAETAATHTSHKHPTAYNSKGQAPVC